MGSSGLDDAIRNAVAWLPSTALAKKVRGALDQCPLSLLITEKLELSWADREIHGSALGPIDGVVVTIQTFLAASMTHERTSCDPTEGSRNRSRPGMSLESNK